MRRRLPSLTGLRFLAAAFVVLFHLQDYLRVPDWADALTSLGPAGVSFFFVLSGFVLTWSRDPSTPTGRFYRRRFARVYPNHLLCLLIALPLTAWLADAGVRQVHGPTVAGFLANLGVVHAWSSEGHIVQSFDAVSWSLSCEAFFYLCFPFIIRPISAAGVTSRRVLAVALAVGMVIVALGVDDYASFTRAGWFVYFFPPVRLAEFVLGIIVAMEVRDWRGRAIDLRLALLAYAGAALIVPHVSTRLGYASITLVPTLLVIAAAAQRDLAGGRSWFASAPMQRLGDASFALYLIHPLLFVPARYLFPPAEQTTAVRLLTAAALAATAVGLSLVMYRTYERPMERWIRGHDRDRRSAPDEVAVE